MGQLLPRREKSSGAWVWSLGAAAALGLLWAPHGAPAGGADFPWLPGRADAAVRVPPAGDSPANSTQPPWLHPLLAILGRCLLPPHATPLLSGGGHQRRWPGAGGQKVPPRSACPIYLTPACQLRLSNPGLCVLGQFPLNQLNPHLLHSQKLFSLAPQVSETPPERLCCLGLAPGWFKSCRRCSLCSRATRECRLGTWVNPGEDCSPESGRLSCRPSSICCTIFVTTHKDPGYSTSADLLRSTKTHRSN